MGLTLGLHFADQYPGPIKEELEQIINAIQNSLNNQSTLINEVSSAIGVGTFAQIPTGLGTGDAGFRYRVTDYGHEIVWDGSVWGFAPGDSGSGYYAVFQVTPEALGWQLCDGTITKYLTLGATPAEVNFTTPGAAASATYLKSGGAISTAPSITAPTGATYTTPVDHTHINPANFGADFSAANFDNAHVGTTNADMDVRHISGLLYFRR